MASVKTSNGATVERFGLSEVYSAEDPLVDIVLVHGLHGHPYLTWTTKDPSVFWPADLLPSSLQNERVRILTYGYNADVAAFMTGTSGVGGASKDNIPRHAETLVSELCANRSLAGDAATQRPIVFICHSLGGLVVKSALTYSSTIQKKNVEHLRSIYLSTYGILFLGTPHLGSDLAKWGSILESIARAMVPKAVLHTSPRLVNALKRQSESLAGITRYFESIDHRFQMYFFHEGLPMNFGLTKKIVVDEASATPLKGGVSHATIQADHANICKFSAQKAPGYLLVVEAIKRSARDAPAVVKARWAIDKEILLLHGKDIAMQWR
ncbi:hypothetical protein L228DRAFT_245695 [Xylona heveae TC161]|uniref:DUF676 domain-containing protein n=1 Tax=Xylona heveae (strain CBS 132557 / TC161) TaxID=1328760 RepID=A0A165ICM5_XYLHT|nr:hypothetical protein L228DRAFT_245695 [Xylona heveae TC161]KZF24708.1 hypothetical protein L228DRAFT_245695 [Xylona heveae TC161]